MAQEFFINSEQLQRKVSQLLPSQGGAGAGFDLSATTQIVPIIDLTESAEGSNVRADIQTSLSFQNVTEISINTTVMTTIINNTGYWRLFGVCNLAPALGGGRIQFNDGASTKTILDINNLGTSGFSNTITPFDFTVLLTAGVSVEANTSGSSFQLSGVARQIADINGNLIPI